MATENPYAADPDRGAAWELGYQQGYAEPDVEHAPPLAPEYLDVYREGEFAGRSDWIIETGGVEEPPPGEPVPGEQSQPGEHGPGEAVAEFLTLEVAPHVVLDDIFGAVGGLAALLVSVVQIPGDVSLRTLEPNYSAPADQPGDIYVAVCPASHPLVLQSVTPDGYWVGPVRQQFLEARSDALGHEHAEAFVALCSTTTGACGPVQAASD